MNNSEVDINVLVTLYNQKIASLTNQNVLLEAKIQTLKKDFEEEKNNLLAQLLEFKKGKPVSNSKIKSSIKDDDFHNSEVEE